MDTVNRGERGRFVVNGRGDLVPVLAPPAGVELYAPASAPDVPVQGPTRVGEWLMVDVRVAKCVSPASELYETCQALGDRGACGVIESTLVIDLLEARSRDRQLLLDEANWLEAVARARDQSE